MAGMVDITKLDKTNATVNEANASIDALNQAGSQLRGYQQDAIKQLFAYDKSLSERYSSPDSKMYIERASDRYSSIFGYSKVAREEITNLYDLMEIVRKQKDALQETIDELKKKVISGSGTGSGVSNLSPSSLLGILRSNTGAVEVPPPPPRKLQDFAAQTEGAQIYYVKNDNGTFSYTVKTPGSKIDEELYKPYISAEETEKQAKEEENQLMTQFGIDRNELARLAALEVYDPKLAQSKLKEKILEVTVGRKLEKEDIMAGVKPTDPEAIRLKKLEKFYTEGGGADSEVRKDINKWKNVSYLADRALSIYESGVKTKVNQTKLASVMSQLASFYATGEGGKTLTENEWALIAGAVPQPEIKKPNVAQRAFGIVPPQSGKIVDEPKTAIAKLESLKQTAMERYPFLEGKMLSPIEQKNLEINAKPFGGSSEEDTKTILDSIGETPIVGAPIKGAYTLIAKPMVDAAIGYTKLLRTAGAVTAAPYLAHVMTPKQYENYSNVVEDLINDGYATPWQAITTGALQTAAFMGATVDIATLGKATAAKQLIKTVKNIGLRNVIVNAPIFGLGSAFEAIRENQSEDTIAKRTMEGILGQRFVGPFVGTFGESSTAQAADIALSTILPIVGQKFVKKIMTGEAIYPSETKQEVFAAEFSSIPKHEAAFAKALQDGNLDEAKAIAESLSSNNPYKDLYLQAISNAENAPNTLQQTLRKVWNDTRSRWASKVFTADPESVVRSEEIAKKAIQMTKSKTIYGMAKEMPELRKSAGLFVDTNIKNISDAIGPMDRDETLALIMDKIDESSASQANPNLRQSIEDLLRRLLYSGSPDIGSEMARRGAMSQTTLNKMNEVRKALNGQIDSGWFQKGMPTASNTENINALKWIASSTIKEMIKESDPTGRIAKAIELEHISFATEPVLSKIALKQRVSGQFGGITTRLYNFIANAINTVVEPIEITSLRKSFGEINVPSAEIASTEKAAVSAAKEATGFTRKPIAPEMIDIIVSNKAKKAPAQAARFLEDLGSNLSDTRRMQDKALRKLKGVKYK